MKREMVAVRRTVSSVAGLVLCWTVMVKWELSWQNQLVCVPSLTYGHVLWVVSQELGHQEESQSRAPAPSCGKEPAEVIQASDQKGLSSTSLWRFSKHNQLGGDPRADQELTGGLSHPAWECLGIP